MSAKIVKDGEVNDIYEETCRMLTMQRERTGLQLIVINITPAIWEIPIVPDLSRAPRRQCSGADPS